MGFKLRDYQTALNSGIYNAWGKGHKNVLGVMATGLGKAKTLCQLIGDEPGPGVIVVHRQELLSQLSMDLAGMDVTHNIIAQKKSIVNIMRLNRQKYGKSYYNYHSNVTIISVKTLISRMALYKDWAKKYKIVDCR